MYRVDTEQRGATVLAVPRRRDAGWTLDLDATRAAARKADVVWLCSPNNPTAMPEPDGAIAGLLVGILADAVADGRTAPIVVIDEAYAEFTGESLVGLRADYPNLIVIRTASKAYALAGLRVGFAIAHPSLIARMNPYRPPGSISVVSVTLVTEALLDDTILEAQPAARRHRAGSARERAARHRLVGRPLRHELHPRRLRLGRPRPRRSPRVCCATASCHGPSRTATRWPITCALTIRSTEENDRFIAAATAIAKETGA